MSDFQLKYPNLFTPIQLGNTVFRNRIFCAPTGYQLLRDRKRPPYDAMCYFERKAMGGAATVTMGECVVDNLRGRSGANHTELDDPENIGPLSVIANGVGKYGAVPVVELQHAGMFGTLAPEIAGEPVYGPVDMIIHGAVAYPEDRHIHEMPEHAIEDVIEKFANAALVAKRAGFGMVLVHGGHGWLLSQFMSPKINTRRDRWGGALENACGFR